MTTNILLVIHVLVGVGESPSWVDSCLLADSYLELV
jgi:hypothetical protein